MYDEKASLEDTLEHFGVKGMKWGKHAAKGSIGDKINNVAVKLDARDQAIGTARANQAARKANVRAAKKDARFWKPKEQRQAAKVLVKKHKDIYLSNPDRVTAAKMTSGEAILELTLAGPVGAARILINNNTRVNSIANNVEKRQNKLAAEARIRNG